MINLQIRKRIPLKVAYYMSFLLLIVIPILVVLMIALLILNQQFKRQAIENIERAQETIITELVADINNMSMRLSHLVYTNNNEILEYASGTDTNEWNVRYAFEQKLNERVNLVLEPVKDIVSVGFYMKSGRKTYIKNDINRTSDEVKRSKWYQTAQERLNTVCVGSYDTEAMNDLYTGGKKDSLILVFALAPDVTTDRSQKIEMVTFYQSAAVADRIKRYNMNYLAGNNKLGITQITNQDGELVFSTQEENDFVVSKEYTCVESKIQFHNITWNIESYIKTSELTSDYWTNALYVLCAAGLVLLLSGYYSRYFLRSIVKPVEEISSGLRQVEEGKLDVHLTPMGQFEIRSMIHQFNAMVRRLKVLINEYEEKVKAGEKKPKDYLAAMIKGEMSPKQVHEEANEFFTERYAVLGFFVENYDRNENEKEVALRLAYSFERNPRFASRCIVYIESTAFFLVYYRIIEEDYSFNVMKMAEEIQRDSEKEFGVHISIYIGKENYGHLAFDEQVNEIREMIDLRYLMGSKSIIHVNQYRTGEQLLHMAKEYEQLAEALYIADEKNMVEYKEAVYQMFGQMELELAKQHVYAIILEIGIHFNKNNTSFSDIFGQSYNYIDKIERITDFRKLKLWVTNYFAWIMDYSASKLNITETDITVKAKRYIADHYEDAQLSLVSVAEYVGLNDKYFSTRFTKEAGETFSSYLTGIRMMKAKSLLKNTSFKVYEIAEMVGYQNVEHFNRMFKKLNDVSPAQYRKTM